MFRNFHIPLDWQYICGNTTYIKIGAYGTEDLVVVKHKEGVYLPDVNRLYDTIEEAYTEENKIWQINEQKGWDERSKC